MDETQTKLDNCFLTVFPSLDRAQLPGVSAETLAAWDSVSHLTLLTLVCEEFGIEMDLEYFEGVTSYPAMLDRVRRRLAE